MSLRAAKPPSAGNIFCTSSLMLNSANSLAPFGCGPPLSIVVDEVAVLVLGGVRHLVEILRLEGDNDSYARQHGRGCGIGCGQHIGCYPPGVDLLLEAAEDGGAAGAEHLDLDAVFLLEQVDDLLRLRKRRRGVPDHLALGLGFGEVDGILRGSGSSERDDRKGSDQISALEHCS